jgi:ABC-2 type transport system permease protein
MTLLLGALVFGVDLDLPRALLGIPVACLGALAFAPFGLLSAAMVLMFKQAAVGVALVLAAISLMSGLYFPVDLLPDWIQWSADVQPFTPTVDLMRHVLVDAPLRTPALLELAKIVGFTAAMVPLSLWALARTVRFTRRRGTIIEY